MTNQNQAGKSEDGLVYVGTYTQAGSEGIYLCQLDHSTGELRQAGVTSGVDNPSYLALDRERKRLFAVNEGLEFEGQPGGSISAFAVEPGSGDLRLVNKRYSQGGAPCYLVVDRTGRYLLLVNYMGGNVAVLPIGEDGALGEPSGIVTHQGSSQNPARQEGPHPHSIILDPSNRFAFLPDLGLDRVMQYRFDAGNGRLRANNQPWIAADPGSGPRHLVFQPDGRRAYVIHELISTISAYNYDADRGVLALKETISTLPEGYTGQNMAADIQLSPNGRFLYGSNRGHNSIARYTVDPETGWLTSMGFTSSGGETPRGFAIDPTGRFLLAANQDSHAIVSFRIDPERGGLIPTGHQVRIPSPVCLKFWS